MKKTIIHLSKTFVLYLLLGHIAYAVETEFHGIFDIRASSTDSIDSYLTGGHGKFGLSDGNQLSIAQAGAQLALQWNSGFSAHIVANAFIDNEDSAVGLTEGYLKYKGLPNAAGYRYQAKFGVFYPEISLENNAYAWASKDTLNSSAINTWLGEEIRVLGGEIKVTRLGKLTHNKYDLSFSASMFTNNDPAGALLSWHGWTLSSRQTLWTEKRPFPFLWAQNPGGELEGQARISDPFLELDNRIGFHVNTKWKLHGKGELSLGYYNNNAKPYVVKNGQYGWATKFTHIGARWSLPAKIKLTAQYLTGNTKMQTPSRQDVVNNDFESAFIALSKRWSKHKTTLRIETFSVTDNDDTWGDNNDEDGDSVTLSYSYNITKQWFLAIEGIWIDSQRPSRVYTSNPISLTEQQVQFASRYFF